MSITETFLTSIFAAPRTANTAISKDIGIYTHTLSPTFTTPSAFKKSSTRPNCLAVSPTHIFAAQADKAVVHVYSRERGNQEALISFPERIHSIHLLNEGLLALGTAEGRVILWEVMSGRQVSTPTSHLQPVTCLAGDSTYLVSGSEDSNILVWSVPSLISLSNQGPHEPLRTLSNHRAGITALALGHSNAGTNIVVSASKDNTAIVWNHSTGTLLRTFLLPSTPSALALDPADRAFYVGYTDSSVALIDLYNPTASTNSLYDVDQQSTPLQIVAEKTNMSGAPSTLEAVNCLGVSYDGTTLLSGHQSGNVISWETGARKFSAELTDLNAPVTNLHMESPFPRTYPVKAIGVSKPKLGEGNHTFTAQLNGTLPSKFKAETVRSEVGFADGVLEEAIMEFMMPSGPQVVGKVSKAADVEMGGGESEELAKLKKENAELWAVVNEQNDAQKETLSKKRKGAGGKKV